MAPPTPPFDIETADVLDLKSSVTCILNRHGYAATIAKLAEALSTPPIELLIALRSPKGAPIQTWLMVDGLRTVVDVNPNGCVDREAEARAWLCIRQAVARRRAA